MKPAGLLGVVLFLVACAVAPTATFAGGVIAVDGFLGYEWVPGDSFGQPVGPNIFEVPASLRVNKYPCVEFRRAFGAPDRGRIVLNVEVFSTVRDFLTGETPIRSDRLGQRLRNNRARICWNETLDYLRRGNVVRVTLATQDLRPRQVPSGELAQARFYLSDPIGILGE
jgi:hypothetical protein